MFKLPLLALLLPSLALASPKPQKDMTPEQVHALLVKPWSGPLLDLKKSFKAGRNYVAWVMVPPHYPLDMRSGNQFKQSFLATPPDDFSISHNLVIWQCTRKDGSHSEGGMAITGENDDQSITMRKTGLGLTSLFSDFTDGELEGTDDVLSEIHDEAEYHGQATVAFEVSADKCEEMLQFVDAYSLDPKRPYQHFSNLQDPAKFEGGGCVTLASTLLKKAGILENVWPHVWRDFKINHFLLGGNLPLPKAVVAPVWPWLDGRPYKATPLAILTLPWDGTSHLSVPLRLMDPELMLYSIRNLALEYLRTVPAEFRAREERIYGHSAFGYREVWSAVGPFVDLKEGYIKAHRLIPLNDTFDAQTAEVGREARAWFVNAERDGLKPRHANVGKAPALIFDKE